MRKISIVALAVLLVTVFAVSSFAAETTFSGSYRVRSVWDENWEKTDTNVDPFAVFAGTALSGLTSYLTVLNAGPADYRDVSTRYFDQRFQLNIDHTQSEFLKAGLMIDIYEDTWGQGRPGRINNADGTAGDADITAAWLEFITPIGQFKLGKWPGSEFGPGLWSDGYAGGAPDDQISWAAKFDLANGAFIFTSLTYTKYTDEATRWLEDAFGARLAAYPGRAHDRFHDSDSSWYNSDLNAYTFATGYIDDNFRAGALFSWFDIPGTIAGAYLVKHIAGFIHATGEAGHGWNGDTGNPFGPSCAFGTAPGGAPGLPYYGFPTPLGAAYNGLGVLPPGAAAAPGFGRGGLYDTNLFLVDMWVQLDFFDDMLKFEAEFYRAWGSGHITTNGKMYNDYLDNFNANNAVVILLTGMNGIDPGARIPSRIGVDGWGFYTDLTFDFDVFNVGVSFLMVDGGKHYSGLTQDNFIFITTGGFDTFHWGNIICRNDQDYLNPGYTFDALGLGKSPENVTSLKFHWSVCPIEDLDIHGAVIWAKYTEEVGRYAIDAAGNPVHNWHAYYMHPMNYMDGSSGSYYHPAGLSDDLGWEIDAGFTWSIMEGLTLNSEFGVFFPGEAFDYRIFNGTSWEREEWDEIYTWTNTLTYEF